MCDTMREGEFLWLVDDSVKSCAYKLGETFGIYIGNDGFVRSARVKMAHGELIRPVVKLALIFYNGASEIKNRVGGVDARHQEKTFESERI